MIDFTEAIRAVHAEPEVDAKLVIAVAGNGAEAIGELTRHGRASATLLAHHLLYANESVDRYVGRKPERYVSERTARQLAMAAHLEADGILSSRPAGADRGVPVGIGCTSSLAKPDGERAGREHLIFVAVQDAGTTTIASHVLSLGRTREWEEEFAARAILHEVAMARAPQRTTAEPTFRPERMIGSTPETICRSGRTTARATDDVRRLVRGEIAYAVACGDPAILDRDHAMLSGSFDPLHHAHLGMAEHAARALGRPVVFELSIANVDKPPLDYVEIDRRVAQFASAGLPLVLTNRPKFAAKATAFRAGTAFVVGVDTYVRLVDPKYYAGEQDFADAVRTFNVRGTRFLVYPRRLPDGTVARVRPGPMDALCTAVPEAEFLIDVSSTELRRGGASRMQ